MKKRTIMLFTFLLLLNFTSTASTDPITVAIENYKIVKSYKVTLRSKENSSIEVIKYYYKEPGYVRMEFINPNKGAILVYDPTTKKVKIKPFTFFNSLIFTLDPDNYFIKSAKGHRVDESDIGALLKTVKTIQNNGKTKILANENIGKKATILIKVNGEKGFAINNIHGYLLWLDKKNMLPVKVTSYDSNEKLIEEVLMEDIEINIKFKDDFFNF